MGDQDSTGQSAAQCLTKIRNYLSSRQASSVEVFVQEKATTYFLQPPKLLKLLLMELEIFTWMLQTKLFLADTDRF